MAESQKLDDLNVKILEILLRDARISVADMARELKLPHSTVSARIHNLEEKGYIKGYQAILDRAKIGLPVTAFIQTKCKPSKHVMRELVEPKMRLPNVPFYYSTSGDYVGLTIVYAKDNEQVYDILRKMRSLPLTTDSNVIIATKVYKEYGPYSVRNG